MRIRSMFLGTAALAAVTLTPSQASAQGGPGTGAGTCGILTYAATIGLGGNLSGCFNFTLSELGENAGAVASQSYWAGTFAGTTGAPSNAPVLPGTNFFNDDCGSNGSNSFTTFAFCNAYGPGPLPAPPTDATHFWGTSFNPFGELVFGMLTPDLSNPPSNGGTPYWNYSGNPSRNGYPPPAGFQEVMYQLTDGGGNVIPGEFLFAWEDINSGCLTTTGSALHPSLTNFAVSDLGNKQVLDDPNNCSVFTPTASDNDFNDSYIVLSISGTRLDTVTPEPMTMTLMATGLIALGGASLRRRKKN